MVRYLFAAIGLLVGLALAGVFVLGTRQSEIALWESIQNSKDPAKFEIYLQEYPKGDFADLAENRLASSRRAEAEAEVKRTKADHHNELMESERKDAKEFWKTVTPRDAALLVSDTRPGNWPVFTLGDKDYNKDFSRLHLAARWGNDEIARLLLEKGADIYVRNRRGSAALDIARTRGYFFNTAKLVELLQTKLRQLKQK